MELIGSKEIEQGITEEKNDIIEKSSCLVNVQVVLEYPLDLTTSFYNSRKSINGLLNCDLIKLSWNLKLFFKFENTGNARETQ
jgi:hypothetical protein